MQNPKNFSDLLFEEYLISQGITDFVYEKEHTHTNRKPDYIFAKDSRNYVFDVKEFEGVGITEGHMFFTPSYQKIREKINHSIKQFKDFKNESCCLVLYSFDFGIDRDLHCPSTIYGAMYGDVGWTIPIILDNKNSDIPKTVRTSFGGSENKNRGKMLRYDSKGANRPIDSQNTTVSALIVLREFVNNELGCFETLRSSENKNSISENSKVGVIVYENRFARNSFPKNLFCGDFDIRFGFNGNVIKKEFVGKEILNNRLDIDKDNKFLISFE